MNVRLLIALLACLVLPFAWPTPANAIEEPCSAELTAMGGIPIKLSAWCMDETAFDHVVRGIGAELAALEQMMSAHTDDGVVALINRHGLSGGPCPVALARVLQEAQGVSTLTDGAFDVTVRPLITLWKQAAAGGRLPTVEEREAALTRVGFDAVELDQDRIRFAHEGISLDLGGVAKGYFGDVAIARLRQAGACRCIADVGADLVSARNPEEQPFRIGIRSPWGDGLMGTITTDGGAVVTSGDYERYVTIDDHRYSHIVDPRTGMPVEGMHSVTVLASTGVEADALATGIYVMGLDGGSALVESREDLEAIIVADDPQSPGKQRVFISSGLVDRFRWSEDVLPDTVTAH